MDTQHGHFSCVTKTLLCLISLFPGTTSVADTRPHPLSTPSPHPCPSHLHPDSTIPEAHSERKDRRGKELRPVNPLRPNLHRQDSLTTSLYVRVGMVSDPYTRLSSLLSRPDTLQTLNDVDFIALVPTPSLRGLRQLMPIHCFLWVRIVKQISVNNKLRLRCPTRPGPLFLADETHAPPTTRSGSAG